jgi:hypothetical protein
MQTNRSGVLQQVVLDRRRAARMIVLTLLIAVILTDATQVSSHIRAESSPSIPWNQSTPAPMPLRAEVAMRIERMDMLHTAPQMTRPLQNRAISERSLVLTGVIAYTDPKQGFAIIGSSARNTYLARPGQQLPDGSRLREIHPKYVVLEYGGSVEVVGMHERGQPDGELYAQFQPLPQQTQREEAALTGVTAGDTTPGQARPIDTPPGHPRSSDTRPSEALANEVRSNDALPSDTVPSDVPPKTTLPRWAQSQTPSPAAQDPADDWNDYRRRRAVSRGLFPTNSSIQTE